MVVLYAFHLMHAGRNPSPLLAAAGEHARGSAAPAATRRMSRWQAVCEMQPKQQQLDNVN